MSGHETSYPLDSGSRTVKNASCSIERAVKSVRKHFWLLRQKSECHERSALSANSSLSCFSEHAGIAPSFCQCVSEALGERQCRLHLLEGLGLAGRSWKELAVAKHPIRAFGSKTVKNASPLTLYTAVLWHRFC